LVSHVVGYVRLKRIKIGNYMIFRLWSLSIGVWRVVMCHNEAAAFSTFYVYAVRFLSTLRF
jgi:hypothetical protein